MMLTEAEAATKRCPMSFGPPAQAPAVNTTLQGTPFSHSWNSNGVGYVPSPLNCIGSGCMAWVEWSPADPGRVIGRDESTGALYYEKGTQKPATGRCGLARV